MAWMIWTDSSSNQLAGGVEVLLRSSERGTIKCVVRLQFSMTNNESEYKEVLSGLDLVKAVRAKLVVVHCDLQVVVGHINGDCEAKRERTKKYLSMVKCKMCNGFSAKFLQVPREENE